MTEWVWTMIGHGIAGPLSAGAREIWLEWRQEAIRRRILSQEEIGDLYLGIRSQRCLIEHGVEFIEDFLAQDFSSRYSPCMDWRNFGLKSLVECRAEQQRILRARNA